MSLGKLLQSRDVQLVYKGKEKYATFPVFFYPKNKDNEIVFRRFLEDHPTLNICDTIISQLEELIKIRNPSTKLGKNQLDEMVEDYLGDVPKWAYGVWVYYPWNNHLIHLLDEQEFVEVRTSRNLYKITPEEHHLLATKKIGVIGLSVGQSVALTLAMERSFGELRIADFDTLELSNVNRIRTGLKNLGQLKTVIVAREIAEIDPFLKVTCFPEGIHADNIESFLHQNGDLDLLIDECDSLDIKILCRQKAKQAGIPVLMDTSDRGMVDIERFDLEPDREILHGLLHTDGVDFTKVMKDEKLRIRISTQIGGADAISDRLKKSLSEIGKTISTWPQLASSVTLGGAVVAETSRKILCKKSIPSGRFYVDTQQIIKN